MMLPALLVPLAILVACAILAVGLVLGWSGAFALSAVLS
jgi:hypothetical protein